MGISLFVTAFKPADEKWFRMKAVWDACGAALVPIPKDVSDYFNGEAPDDSGVEVELVYGRSEALVEYSDDYRGGYEIALDKLPKDVKTIRVYLC